MRKDLHWKLQKKCINSMTELVKSTKQLYNDIDACIDDLLDARFNGNESEEHLALCKMESLLVDTLQQLDCILDYLDS